MNRADLINEIFYSSEKFNKEYFECLKFCKKNLNKNLNPWKVAVLYHFFFNAAYSCQKNAGKIFLFQRIKLFLFLWWLAIKINFIKNNPKIQNFFIFFPSYMEAFHKNKKSIISFIKLHFSCKGTDHFESFEKTFSLKNLLQAMLILKNKKICKYLKINFFNIFFSKLQNINFITPYLSLSKRHLKRVFYPADCLNFAPFPNFTNQIGVAFSTSPWFVNLKNLKNPHAFQATQGFHINILSFYKKAKIFWKFKKFIYTNKIIPFYENKLCPNKKFDIAVFYEHLDKVKNVHQTLVNLLYTNHVSNNLCFLEDILAELANVKDKKLSIVFKGKRNLRCHNRVHEKKNFLKILQISKNIKHNLFFANSNLSPSQLIKNSKIVISMPFSTTGIIACKLRKKSFFYDPLKILTPNHYYKPVKLIQGPDQLKTLFQSI